MIDFYTLNNILNSHKKELLSKILPYGKFEGHEYTALNPRRYDNNLGSFRINFNNLVWCDFATGDKGKGLIHLYAYIKNIKLFEAALELTNLMNIEPASIGFSSKKSLYYNHNKTTKPQEPSNKVSSSSVFSLDAGIQKLIMKLWRSAVSSEGTIVEAYLQQRGITGKIPSTIRYLANHTHRPSGINLPCMIAAITRWPEQKIIALHRTYLNADGSDKAPVTPCKMMIGKTYGGAVRLSPVSEILIIAEGIETALSLNCLSVAKKYCVWSTLTASGYINLILPPPPLAATIIIAADNDPAGIKAAKIAATKWIKEGRKVKIALPPENSDFNDILMKDIWE
jgi:hypothetical protein